MFSIRRRLTEIVFLRKRGCEDHFFCGKKFGFDSKGVTPLLPGPGRRADLGEGRLDHPAPRAKRTLRWSMMRVMCEWMLAFMLTLGFAIGVAQHVGHGFCEMLRESFAGVVAAF